MAGAITEEQWQVILELGTEDIYVVALGTKVGDIHLGQGFRHIGGHGVFWVNIESTGTENDPISLVTTKVRSYDGFISWESGGDVETGFIGLVRYWLKKGARCL